MIRTGSMRRRGLPLIAITAAVALAQNASAPEMSTHDAPAIFTARVNLVLVPVVVRDRNGKATGNLRQGDFQLSDKGKPQVISKFSIEKTGGRAIPAVVATDETAPDKAQPEPAPIPERFVAYVFDDMHFDIQNLLWARMAADRHLSEFLDPSARAAIFTTSGQVSLDFTDDRDKLRAALQRIQSRADLHATAIECPSVTYYMADSLINRADSQAMNVLVADTYACLHTSPNDPGAPSRDQIEAMVRAAAQREYSVGGEDSRRSLLALKDAVRRLSAAPGSRSLILVSPGFYLTLDHRFDETDLMDRAIRANVTVNSLDTRGLYTVGTDLSQTSVSSSAASSGFRLMADIANASADSDVMAELASATGGTFFHNDNGLKEGLKQLATQPEFIYVLGFSPQNLKMDGSYHTLKVTLKNPTGMDVQARRGYYAPKHAADPEQQAREEIQEAIFSRDEIRDIPVDLNLQFFKSSASSAKVTVVAKVDIRNLRYRKSEDRNNNTLTIISSLFDRNGNWVAGIQKIVEMRLKDQTVENLPAGGISVRSVLDVVPGSYMVRLVVRDSEGQTMAARNGAVQIP
ncbi:MAG: VWA domain-containing protein [Bryobacterales bacterium]|nr:VWA domain-containing protein [Bryobacterales bacterium]